tara:strand:- start:1363 stop:1797 length:435 start_codon:yes stop_codon:yes gene_type:complete
MSSLNIDSLYEKMNENNMKRYGIFDDILKQLHRKIRYHASLEKMYCFFKIPEFIIGVPLYKIDDLRNYIFMSLEKDNFQYIYIDPNWLFISWEKRKNIPTTKNNKKKGIGNYKLIDEYKPSGKFIYNDYDISSMKQKMDYINKR